jgi:hypothetical protein
MKNFNWKSIGFLGAILILAGSCDLINPEEGVPAYIHFERFQMEGNPGINHGSISHSIQGARVFVGGEPLGIHTFPITLPILQEGEQEVILDPFVEVNGVGITLDIYPFYERFSQMVTLTSGEVDTLQPVTRYRTDLEFYVIEDFEFGQPVFTEDRDGNEETFLDTTSLEVFEGDFSGVVRLDTANVFIDAATSRNDLFALKDGGVIWLEVNYKTDTDILFGLIGVDNFGQTTGSFDFGIRASPAEWRKIYFNLTDRVRTSFEDEFQLVFTSGLPFRNGAFQLEEAEVYLDNIKLISFQQ